MMKWTQPSFRRKAARSGTFCAVRAEWRETAVPVAIAAAVVLVVAWLLPALPSRQLTVKVDMNASAGSVLALYLNDLTDPPQVAQLVPGERRTYAFKAPKGDISRIRVDVADRAGVGLRIFAIDVLNEDGGLAAHFGPPELATWARYFLSDPINEPEALFLTSRAAGAAFDSLQTVRAPSRLPGALQPTIDALEDPSARLRFALVGLGLGACLLALASPGARSALAIGAAATLSSLALLDIVLSNPEGVSSASEALGRATYFGLSLPTNLRAVRVEYMAAVLLALCGAFFLRWRSSRGRGAILELGGSGAVERPNSRSLMGFLAAVVTILAALATFVPDLRKIVHDTMTTQHLPGWDVENLLSWTAFSARGLVPMRDFWYPYGNSDVFASSLLTGPALYAVYEFILFLAFWWVFWVASDRRLAASSLAALGLLFAQPVIGEFSRYGLALCIALAFSCIDPDSEREYLRRGRIIFGLVTTMALFVEPILVVYAAVGVVTALIVDMFLARRRGVRWWLHRLAGDFAIPVCGLVAWVVTSALRGQLDGMVDFYLALGETSTYSAEPTPLDAGFGTALELSVLIIWMPAVFVAVGLFARLREGADRLEHTLGSRLLIIGAVAFPLIHKHAVRPLPTQLLLFLIVAGLLFLVAKPTWQRSPNVVAALGGLGLAAVLAFPGPRLAYNGLDELPGRVARSFDLVLSDRDAIARANDIRFGDARFVHFPQELAVAADLRPRLDPRRETNVYVLGDAPILYVLLAQRPPWQLTPYNTSQLDGQRRAVDFLADDRPRYVVVDRTTDSFDGVPHDVRIPLVFQYVIENYVFDHSVGPFDVLRRRPEQAPRRGPYWTQALSNDADLGRVPDLMRYDELHPCRTGRECGAFLRLSAPAKSWKGQVQVPVRFGPHVVSIRFLASGKRAEYTIPLARTWAWGLSHTPHLAAPITPGWRARITAGEQRDDILY
jgi:hypothetical protein